jgi:hypothetical protein
MKPNREIIINEILSEMDFGITRAEALAMNSEKWQLPTRTFDRQWKEASRRYLAANEKSKQAAIEVKTEAIKNRASKGILSKEERLEILSQIARGDLSYQQEVPSKFGPQTITAWPSFNDRKGAVAEINKMEGDYAPIQKDITSKGGSIAPAPIFNIVLDNDDEL